MLTSEILQSWIKHILFAKLTWSILQNQALKDCYNFVLIAVIKIGIPVIALAIIYSGFLFVSAQGNSEKIKKAKDAILYSLIGAAILLGSWAIAQLISNTVLKIS